MKMYGWLNEPCCLNTLTDLLYFHQCRALMAKWITRIGSDHFLCLLYIIFIYFITALITNLYINKFNKFHHIKTIINGKKKGDVYCILVALYEKQLTEQIRPCLITSCCESVNYDFYLQCYFQVSTLGSSRISPTWHYTFYRSGLHECIHQMPL